MTGTDEAPGPRRAGGSDGRGPGRRLSVRTPVRWLLVSMLGILAVLGATRTAYSATVYGTVTYLYDRNEPERADVGARVELVRLPPAHRLTVAEAQADHDLTFARIPGTLRASVNGLGAVEFDNVRPGRYLVFILSGVVLRDPSSPLDRDEIAALRPLYASEAALERALGKPYGAAVNYSTTPPSASTPPPDWTRFRANATAAILLTVQGARASFSYDFGTSYA